MSGTVPRENDPKVSMLLSPLIPSKKVSLIWNQSHLEVYSPSGCSKMDRVRDASGLVALLGPQVLTEDGCPYVEHLRCVAATGALSCRAPSQSDCSSRVDEQTENEHLSAPAGKAGSNTFPVKLAVRFQAAAEYAQNHRRKSWPKIRSHARNEHRAQWQSPIDQ